MRFIQIMPGKGEAALAAPRPKLKLAYDCGAAGLTWVWQPLLPPNAPPVTLSPQDQNAVPPDGLH